MNMIMISFMLADVANLWLAVVMGCLFRSNITQTVPQGVKGRLRKLRRMEYIGQQS